MHLHHQLVEEAVSAQPMINMVHLHEVFEFLGRDHASLEIAFRQVLDAIFQKALETSGFPTFFWLATAR